MQKQEPIDQTDSIRLSGMCHGIHRNNLLAGWWKDASNPLIVSNKLMLVVSELAEAMEGDRKDLMDDKLPHRKMVEVELADAFIRIADLAGYLGCDLGTVVREKMEYNISRADHKPESRQATGGKKY